MAYNATVQGFEQFVLIHGTKLRLNNNGCVNGVKGLLDSIKHVTVNELQELLETIARVTSKDHLS